MYDFLIRFAADGLVIVIVIIALVMLFAKTPARDRYDRYTRVFMAGISSYLLAKFAGSVWQPASQRPFEQLGIDPGAAYLNNPGFPSDHALLAFFLVFAVWYATRNRAMTIVLLVLAVVMCAGRVLALVHTPLDIAGSFVIAAIAALWYTGYGKNQSRKTIAKRAKK
ncbi:MAG: phosphatase PAP2 family protein [Candidatus Saccharimonas sp.]